MRRSLLMALGATALATTSVANATSFVGNTTGCFSAAPCTFGSPVSITATPLNSASTGGVLTFTSGQFNQTDAGGFVAIGSGTGTDTLGTFSLTSGTGLSSFNAPFSLLVSFTSPASVAGNGTFFSTITGNVSDAPGGGGGVFVDFDNTPHLFTSAAGAFTLTVRDLNVSTGATATPITGQINAVPEATTWAMMLLGFAGIGFAMRRRRTPVLAQLA